MSNPSPSIKANFKHFFDSKIQLSMYFLIPYIAFSVYLVYIYLNSKNTFYQLKKLSDHSLKSKIKTVIMILVCCLYEIGLTFIYDSHISTTDEMTYIFLIFLKIVLLIFIIFHIKSQTVKSKLSPNPQFLLFWVLFSFKNLIELKFEWDSSIV
jgi:hypothetical protein